MLKNNQLIFGTLKYYNLLYKYLENQNFWSSELSFIRMEWEEQPLKFVSMYYLQM